ncbi:MAG: tRNA preQ1(34) S-adenosylmethionine ribosyltransferase-isomerase QueA [Gammaproteobacteria bacterium]|nr:MAG: tRNA preQ1(34) S-adenosylmethionine ribosyltransferase-isomerase QueA [Gammaproteobacteria bacterium]
MFEKSDYAFDLPPELIAQYPADKRADSRLLNLCRNRCTDLQFRDLPRLLKSGDLLVFNDTRVIQSRLFGHKSTGGRVEVFVEKIISPTEAWCLIRASRSPRLDSQIKFDSGHTASITARRNGAFRLKIQGDEDISAFLESHGKIPLPPYIQREADRQDTERYQTIYARSPGAVAAPTAGLHFDEDMFISLKQADVDIAFVTLHVGLGTFEPIRCQDIRQHQMHKESYCIPEETVKKLATTRKRGGRIIAIGSTAARTLESAADNREGTINAGAADTSLFIRPGYRFRVVDAMLTNFHLPESSLMVMICTFGGYQRVMRAYQHAIKQKYRFFSYGDAMFIDKFQE